jgi:hypothetical protein
MRSFLTATATPPGESGNEWTRAYAWLIGVGIRRITVQCI